MSMFIVTGIKVHWTLPDKLRRPTARLTGLGAATR